MTVPLLQVEPGYVQTWPASIVKTGAVVNTLPNGFVCANTPAVTLAAKRSASMSVGFFIDNSTIKPANTDMVVPGYALRKGLRVMTLVDNKVMAFRNIID